jgi:AraC-like DNA-binding protein
VAVTCDSELADRVWFDACVSRLQEIAGLALDLPPRDLAPLIHTLADDVPRRLPLQQRFAIRSAIGRAITRLGHLDAIDARSDVARLFLAWAAADLTGDDWRVGLARVVNSWAAALEDAGARSERRTYNGCAGRVMRTIEARFTDPRLTLEVVAFESGASVRHTARVLKQQTGRTFLGHLHRTRIAAARRLLRESAASVKEIAGEVGYVSSSELGRHFKRLTGKTPVQFRLALGAPASDGRNAR